MEKLSDLPNIGNSLEQKLIEAEIKNPQQLVELGSENAFLKLSIKNEAGCYNMLCALEGAVQGVRWHQLSKERKEELKQFLKLKKCL